MNLPNLLLNIHPLHPLHILALVQLPIITHCRPLPPLLLFLAYHRLPRYAVEDIGALRRETLEISCYVGGGEIGCLGAEVGFLTLFFPSGIQELDW